MADFRSDSKVDFGNRTNTTIPPPAGIEDDDGLLIIHAVGGSGVPPTATPPDGFVALPNFPVLYSDGEPGVAFTYRVNAWLKVADGESGDYEVVHAAGLSTAYMLAGVDVDTADPVEPDPEIDTGSGDPTTVPGITTPRDNSLVILWCACWELFNGGTSPPGGSTPTFTERYDGSSTLYVATGQMVTAGATGDKTLDLPAGGGAGVARGMIVLQAAAGATVNADARIAACGRLAGLTAVSRPTSVHIGARSDQIGLSAVLRSAQSFLSGRLGQTAQAIATRAASAQISLRSGARGGSAVSRIAQAAFGVLSRLVASIFAPSDPFSIDDRIIEFATWEDDRTIEFATWEDSREIDLPLITMTAEDTLNPIAKGDARTVRRTFTKLPPGAVITKAWLTIKQSDRDSDAQALIQKDITTSLTAKGRITDADTDDGQIAMFFEITKEDTAQSAINPNQAYLFDIQVLRSTGQPHTLAKGAVSFFRGVTDANS